MKLRDQLIGAWELVTHVKTAARIAPELSHGRPGYWHTPLMDTCQRSSRAQIRVILPREIGLKRPPQNTDGSHQRILPMPDHVQRSNPPPRTGFQLSLLAVVQTVPHRRGSTSLCGQARRRRALRAKRLRRPPQHRHRP